MKEVYWKKRCEAAEKHREAFNEWKRLASETEQVDVDKKLIENSQEACKLIIGAYEDHTWNGSSLKRTAEKMFEYAKAGYVSEVNHIDQLAKEYADLQIGDPAKFENASQLDRHCNSMEEFKAIEKAAKKYSGTIRDTGMIMKREIIYNSFIEGAKFNREDLGTKLIKSMQQVNTLELETEQLINDFKIEIERLTGIIEKLVKDDSMFHVHVQDSYKEQRWQQFKKENKL